MGQTSGMEIKKKCVTSVKTIASNFAKGFNKIVTRTTCKCFLVFLKIKHKQPYSNQAFSMLVLKGRGRKSTLTTIKNGIFTAYNKINYTE